MANVNAPFGLMPYAPGGGSVTGSFGLIERQIVYSDTAKIYFGDPVKNVTAGYIAAWTAGTAVSQLAGIFQGCRYLSQSRGYEVESRYWPGTDVASTSSVWAKIIPCDLSLPQWFVVQGDATGAVLADVGGNYDVTMTAGSVITGNSAVVIAASAATTATLPFKYVMQYRGIDNTGTGAYCKMIVAANITQSAGLA